MKKLFSVLVVLTFVAGQGFATITRTASLGLGNDTWMVQDDDTLLWMNPARTADYQKQVWVEARDTVGVNGATAAAANWGGVTGMCPFYDGATVGLFVNRPYWGGVQNAIPTAATDAGNGITGVPLSGAITLFTLGGGQMVPMTPQTRFEFVYVLPVMDKMTIGARISSAGDTNNQNDSRVNPTPIAFPAANFDEEAVNDRSVQDTNIVIGAKLVDLGPFSVMDVVLNLDTPSATDTATFDVYVNPVLGMLRKDDWEMTLNPGMNTKITARGEMEVNGKPLLVYLDYESVDYSSDFTAKTDANLDGDYIDAGDTNYKQERTQTQKTITIGASHNAKLSDKTLLIVGASLASRAQVYDADTTTALNTQGVGKEKYESTDNTQQLGIAMGVEHKISGVVIGRLGMNQLIMQNNKTNSTATSYIPTVGSTTAFTEDRKTENARLNETLGATNVTYGLGLNVLENLTIDALVTQEIQFTGTWLLSGISQKYVTQVTATYKF